MWERLDLLLLIMVMSVWMGLQESGVVVVRLVMRCFMSMSTRSSTVRQSMRQMGRCYVMCRVSSKASTVVFHG